MKHPFIHVAVVLCAAACGAASAADPTIGTEPHASAPVHRDAACPVENPWSLNDAAHEESAVRERFCLNGYWRFWPDAHAGGIPAKDEGWCWAKVPGSWPSSHRWGLFPYPFVPVMSARWAESLPIDIRRGNWESRNDKTGAPIPFDAVSNAWYQREIVIPPAWQGRRIVLSAESVERTAVVYVGGKTAGALRWPYGEVDLSDYVTPGSNVVLSLFVSGTGGGVRGLAGDVFLEARPAGAPLDEVYLVPSVAHQSLTVRAAVRDATNGMPCWIGVAAELDGHEVFRCNPVRATWRGSELVATVPWRDAALWDFDRPRLHRVRVTLWDAQRRLRDETLPIAMGFREFGVSGREFLLNGVPVHFRSGFYKPIGASMGLADADTVRRVVERMRHQGYNLLVSAMYSAGPGQLHYPRQFLETCDALGMAVQLQLNKATQFMTYTEKDGWQLPAEGLTHWREAVRPQIVRQRQHPSLFFWAANANIFAGPEKANPRDWILKQRPVQRMTGWDMFTRILEVSDATIRTLDGERPIITLGNGNYGDVISTYVYPNFYPRQQQREMPSLWAEQGLKPLMIAEWGNPADISFSSHRENTPRWPDLGFHAEPMPVEYSAIFDGDQAYALDAAGLTLYARLGRLHEQPFSIYHWTRQHAVRFGMDQSFFKTKIDSIREVLPTWRAYGVSAIGILEGYEYRQTAQPEHDYWNNPNRLVNLKSPGVKPDHHPWYEAALTHPEADRYFELTPHGRAAREVFAPILCFIGGHPDQDGGIANRTANAAASARIPCSLIAINDTQQPRRIAARWQLIADGIRINTGAAKWSVLPGKCVVEPLELKAPTHAGSLMLEAVFECDGRQWQDRRLWQVLEIPISGPTRGLTVYDPLGATTKALQRLRIPFTALSHDGALPEGTRLLVIGYRALDTHAPLSFVRTADERGVNMLILAQEANVLSARLGFRYTDVAIQQLTIRRAEADELAGVRPSSMRDWAGSSSLLEPYPDMTTVHHYAHPLTDWLGFKNSRLYRWGNTGSLASVMPEKPVTAGFTYLVDGQFDMKYFGLARVAGARSRLWLSQMDLVARTHPDPAADQLLADLIATGHNRPILPSPACLSAGSRAAEWATRIQVATQALSTEEAIPDSGILLAGPDALAMLDPTRLGRAVERGLRVLAVGWDQEPLGQLTGQAVKTELRDAVYEPPLVNLPAALAGIGPADLFWHGPVPCHAITEIHEAKVATDNLAAYWTPFGTLGYVKRGQGEIVMLQTMPAVEGRPWQQGAHDKLLRLLATILTNWSAPIRNPTLVKYLADPPAAGETRWNAGYYPRAATAQDDPMRWQSW